MASKGNKKTARKRGTSQNPEYDVGYGRPPKEHQFKAGKSGNSGGRPRGSKSVATILSEIFHAKIGIVDNGKFRKIPLIEGMLRKFVERALKGDQKAAAFLLSKYGPAEAAHNARDAKAAAFDAIPNITSDMSAKEAAAIWAETLRVDHLYRET